MSDISNKTIEQLRAEGYLVITWTPEEIGKANFKDLEGAVVQLGNEILEDQNEGCDEDCNCDNCYDEYSYKLPLRKEDTITDF